MYAQPVDAKAGSFFKLPPVSLTQRRSKEKMLGSTAVAKQLLREISDKLASDRIAPEALFARPGNKSY